IKSDVRIIAASNQNLEEAVREKRFREDLYYRLNVITITIPPLRSRRDDIPLLLNHFLVYYAQKNGKRITGFSEEVRQLLMDYGWPGNVRELENLVERAVVLTKGPELTVDHLPELVRKAPAAEGDRIPIPIGMPLEEVENLLIRETLKRAGGDKTLAAKLLGVAPRTIYRKLGGE
ncbi:MAG TPA: sigma 54-interacting transcriptional regulator, partial [Bdellovibrionota bacterium]|nr:sigma 54-interacting transcriptional regulator [Bdellovibrionota bacterium]